MYRATGRISLAASVFNHWISSSERRTVTFFIGALSFFATYLTSLNVVNVVKNVVKFLVNRLVLEDLTEDVVIVLVVLF